MTNSPQQQAETALCSVQMNADVPHLSDLDQMKALQARIRKMASSGNQSPVFWAERNDLEVQYNQLWNKLYNSCPAGRQA
jgi:hypothetical protein